MEEKQPARKTGKRSTKKRPIRESRPDEPDASGEQQQPIDIQSLVDEHIEWIIELKRPQRIALSSRILLLATPLYAAAIDGQTPPRVPVEAFHSYGLALAHAAVTRGNTTSDLQRAFPGERDYFWDEPRPDRLLLGAAFDGLTHTRRSGMNDRAIVRMIRAVLLAAATRGDAGDTELLPGSLNEMLFSDTTALARFERAAAVSKEFFGRPPAKARTSDQGLRGLDELGRIAPGVDESFTRYFYDGVFNWKAAEESFRLVSAESGREPTDTQPALGKSGPGTQESPDPVDISYTIDENPLSSASPSISREAGDDEAALNVHEYARAIARFFRGAEGEFCFGLFGAWGRGKTFLMRRVARELREGAPSYGVIELSAWKYPATPQIWVHLYERFAEQIARLPIGTRLALTARINIARHGLLRGALLLGGLAILVAVSRFAGARFEDDQLGDFVSLGAQLATGLLGGAGIFYHLVRSGRQVLPKIEREYLKLASHTEKLGLQAVIGRDLAALVRGWIPEKHLEEDISDREDELSLLYRAHGFAVLLAGFSALALAMLPYGELAGWNRGVHLVLAAAVLLLGVWTIEKIRDADTGARRLLLVVDDLDRCEPESLIGVMSALKLQLEDESIQKRVQVAMLIDEKPLHAAILRRYAWLSTETNDEAKDVIKAAEDVVAATVGGTSREDRLTTDRLIRENVEKLLVSYLRLPPLSDDEIIEVYERFLAAAGDRAGPDADDETRGQGPGATPGARDTPTTSPAASENRSATAQRSDDPDSQTLDPADLDQKTQAASDPGDRRATAGIPGGAAAEADDDEDPSSEAAPADAGDFVDTPWPDRADPIPGLSRDEIAALSTKTLRAKLGRAVRDRHGGPRTVRAIVFRYQLARSLLQELEHPHDPERLLEMILERAPAGDDPKLSGVVRQVL